MKRSLLIPLLISFALFSQRSYAATINAASPSLTDVTNAIASAVDGDTVIIPAGTASWTGTLSITKGITLQGSTTVSGAGTAGATANDQTILQDNEPRSPLTRMINVNITQSQSFRITGITFAPGTTTVSTPIEGGSLNLKSTGSSANYTIRMDNCHFQHLYQSHYIVINGWNCGVADHNFIEVGLGAGACFMINHGTWLNSTKGHGSWADYPRYGTRDSFFIEDNTIIRPNAALVTDTDVGGGRYVFRHNYVQNGTISNHGTEGTDSIDSAHWWARGGRAFEVYDNTLNYTVAGIPGVVRSGSTIWHDNAFTGVEPTRIATLTNFREGAGIPKPYLWGEADGTSPWDKNVTDVGANPLDQTQQTFVQAHSPFVFDSGTDTSSVNSQGVVHDSSKNWTPNQWVGYSVKKISQLSSTPDDGICVGSYIISNTSNTITYFYYGPNDVPVHLIFNQGDTYQIHKVIAALDQCGSGKADLLSGSPLSDSNCSPVSRTCGTITITGCWSNQRVEPCYSWNNVYTSNGHVKDFATPAGQPTTVLGTDYFNLGGGLPADTIPDAVKSSYVASVNGSDYTGEYTYPHPLTGAATGKIIFPTGNMAFGNVIVGSTPTSTLTVSNLGDTTLTVSSVSYPTGFTGSTGGFTVTAGASHNITVTFSPTTATTYSGNITVASDATSGTNTIAASGTGVTGTVTTKIIFLGGDMVFGNVTVGNTATATLTVSNQGNTTLNVNSISYPTGFSGSTSGFSVAPGTTHDITVTFTPTSTINYSGNIRIGSDATSGTNTIAVSGTGVTPTPTGKIIFLGGDMLFGNVTVGNTATATLTVSNQGDTTLTVSHTSEHCSYLSGFSCEDCMITFRQIPGIMGEIEPGFRFTIFPVRICQLAEEVSFISASGPGLS